MAKSEWKKTMPKPGFKSVTISQTIFWRWWRRWERSDTGRQVKISFSKWITNKILEVMQIQKIKFRFEYIVFTSELVVIRDNWSNDMIHIEITKHGAWCKTCEKEYCIHTGFLWADWRMYHE